MEGGYGEVPDLVKRFVVYFYRHIRERNIREIQSMYEVSFAKLTERFFKASSWPPANMVAGLVDGDHVFCLLYQEMYFRHLYAVSQPSLQQRVESWQNYQALFNVILRGNVNMQLPNVWLWDMVDEFIYQFQSFAQYRGRLQEKSAEEVSLLRKACASGFWDISQVLTYLQALVDKSGIAQDLTTPSSEQRLAQTDGYEPQRSNVLKMLGYYSLLGLLRVHSLIGDYHGGLAALAPLNPFKRKNLLTQRIAGANITLYYYAGFAYLMQQRYLDAASCFNAVLGFISRVKQQYARSSQYDQILKKNEQLYTLLALTLALCPAAQRCVDEVIINILREKHGDKMHRMVQRGDGLHEELFAYACPKFVTAAQPKLDGSHIGVNTNLEAYRLQLRCFLGQVATQQALPALKQTLKLYTSISLPKLAALMEQDQAAVRSQLMTLKATSSCKTWSGQGDATEGTMQPAIDVDFYIDTDPETSVEMVTISDVKPVRRHGEFLARHISKFEEIIRDLNAPAPAAAAAATRAPSSTSAVAAY